MIQNAIPPVIEESFNDINPGLIKLLMVAAIAGGLSGLVGGAFHWSLFHGQNHFLAFVTYLKTHQDLIPGLLFLMVITGCSVAFARWLIRFAPYASGSGVQHIEAVMREEINPPKFAALPVKFIGGIFAVIPQLALGREGPTIQMAAIIGQYCAKLFRLAVDDIRLMYTAVAGAGLSVAFNAPLSGVLFVIEEVAHRVTMRRAMAAMISVATAITVYRGVYGNELDFITVKLAEPQINHLVIYALLGFLMGWLGMQYNRTVMFGLNLFSNTAPRLSPWIKAGLVAAPIAILTYFNADWVGPGDYQVNMVLSGQFAASALIMLLAIRWILSSVSYSFGAPGGLFAPLLLVGAIIGYLFAQGINLLTDQVFMLDPAAFALVAMSAFFAGIVRAPITGILLIMEMSGSTVLAVPLIVASVCANIVPTLFQSAPVYDALRERMLKNAPTSDLLKK
ncbi:ClC family H(+)/Cl(-) exchange transporter [Orrella sp. 11846]|uniref:ClC family H(+)/Cl(-) exchange transporter n=1 Tax=Orrella sp. 11846 TaxID=3409913 RepID=UPI003B5BB290